ncbi:MAG: sporulation transcription factor Spo0A [Ruminococcus sp.]|nr:sporulation transcription factor Spo0A [Ruminococcus sp.]
MQNTPIKVLICTTLKLSTYLASQLKKSGLYTFTRSNDGNMLLNSILSDMPDVVVADLTLSDTDSISIMKKARSILSECPRFIIISDISNSFIEHQVLESGASFFLTQPFDIEQLSGIIKSVVPQNDNDDLEDVEIMVTNIIRNLGIPAHVKGYYYTRTAILECVNSHCYIESITKMLYPQVAKIHSTTPSCVERAIRHAIEIAWHKADSQTMNTFFGYSVNLNGPRPTNAEFIALATDRIVLKLKQNNKLKNSSDILLS